MTEVDEEPQRDQGGPLAGWLFLAISAAAIVAVVNVSASAARSVDASEAGGRGGAGAGLSGQVPSSPPPVVVPSELRPVAPADAVSANAAVAFVPAAITPATPLRFVGDEADRARAVDCLTAAVLYEAGDDQPGQRAVAQVVVNRARHPAFPASICGVVFQGSERRTGCQFTFTCDGALGRGWPEGAWMRARQVATEAVGGRVDPTVGLATHYHTDWVRPYWSDSLVKLVAVGTHLFFRWPGGWGERGAFRSTAGGSEPAISQLRLRFAAHAAAPPPATVLPADAARPVDAVALATNERGIIVADRISMIGTVASASPSRLDAATARSIATPPTSGTDAGQTIQLTLDPSASAESHYALAIAQCQGRAYCKVLGWTDASKRPYGDTLSDAQRSAMTFSYLRDEGSGLERALWNCAVYPRSDRRQCMRR